MDRSLIVDPAMARALLAGRKTQARVLAASDLADCVPGERLWVREACIPARHRDGQDFATSRDKADFAIFADGWRQYPDGGGMPGKGPGKRDYDWITPVHMPRWASRLTLTVDEVRTEHLQAITRRDAQAEGVLRRAGGLLWGWPDPVGGWHLTVRRAFAAWWDVSHPTPGERWADNPLVAVLSFVVEPRWDG